MDVAVVSNDSPGAKEWQATIVPDGLRVEISPDGKPVKIIGYSKGILQGECKVYHPNGKEAFVQNYINGKLEGDAIGYYQDGKIKEKASYENGKIINEFIHYYENGNKSLLIPYVAGVPHGTS